MAEFQKHILTKDQARRLNVPHLAGKTVDITLKTAAQKPTDLADVPIADKIFYEGRYLGGTLSLTE